MIVGLAKVPGTFKPIGMSAATRFNGATDTHE